MPACRPGGGRAGCVAARTGSGRSRPRRGCRSRASSHCPARRRVPRSAVRAEDIPPWVDAQALQGRLAAPRPADRRVCASVGNAASTRHARCGERGRRGPSRSAGCATSRVQSAVSMPALELPPDDARGRWCPRACSAAPCGAPGADDFLEGGLLPEPSCPTRSCFSSLNVLVSCCARYSAAGLGRCPQAGLPTTSVGATGRRSSKPSASSTWWHGRCIAGRVLSRGAS
jgi:hypothetical protein